MRPYFSSGPCVKHVGWKLSDLDRPYLHRSHRSGYGRERIASIILRQKKLLNLPEGYELAMVPGSATGAIEMGLWCFLGSRGVDLHVMDVFSALWAKDAREQLRIKDNRVIAAEYGELPELTHDPDRDLVVTWSATSTGVAYRHGDWLDNSGEGLVIVDATAAAFCIAMPFEKLDVICFSWQKGLGSEAAHGMIALSPKAIRQLSVYKPEWPLPRVLSLWNGDAPNMKVFEGYTINTPSMLALADVENALDWAESIGGAEALYRKASENTEFFYGWVEKTEGLRPFAERGAQTQGGAVCFRVDKFASFDEYRELAATLAAKGLAFDVAGHALSKPSFRVWCGPTAELADLKELTTIFSDSLADFQR